MKFQKNHFLKQELNISITVIFWTHENEFKEKFSVLNFWISAFWIFEFLASMLMK